MLRPALVGGGCRAHDRGPAASTASGSSCAATLIARQPIGARANVILGRFVSGGCRYGVVASATVTGPLSRIFYRIVQTDPPTVRDFMSCEALGIAPRRPLSPSDRDRWRGVSHYARFAAAQSVVRARPGLGAFIASVHIPSDGSVRVHQTGRDFDHFTVWAEPEDLIGWVMSVTAV